MLIKSSYDELMDRLFPGGLVTVAFEARKVGMKPVDYLEKVLSEHSLELEAARVQDICHASLAQA